MTGFADSFWEETRLEYEIEVFADGWWPFHSIKQEDSAIRMLRNYRGGGLRVRLIRHQSAIYHDEGF